MIDAGYGRLLDESLATRCQVEDPVVCAFFRPPRSGERPRRSVSTERWVTASIATNANLQEVQEVAEVVTEELVTTPLSFMRQILLSETGLLPVLPTWTDGEAFCSPARQLRFGVLGGNIGRTTGNTVSDLKRAYVRLLSMNARDDIDPDESVTILCPPTMVKEFELVRESVPFEFESLAIPGFTMFDPWFLIRRPVVVIKMERPITNPPTSKGSLLRLGVRYTLWLDNPASAVCKLRPEMVLAKG